MQDQKRLWIALTLAGLLFTPVSGHADFVINDDLIVDGSACIGFDCVNGEVFSFDTLRLKENNLRIKFDDTSVVPNFPSTDWQLTANESANGGQAKFSIDDISGGRTPFTIEANARSHSLYVDDGGRIGIRTSTPAVEIHVIDGDTPTLRLEQDGSSGFTPQIWDVAGNETNFFIRDVTNGSQLPLRIRPDAPTSSLFVNTDGNVGLGTASPDADADLHIRDSSTVRITLDNTAGEKWTITSPNPGDFRVSDVGDAVSELSLSPDGDLTVTGDVFSTTCVAPCAPDYVFEEGYELMPLAQLGEFVAERKHLPNVPSAGDLVGPVSLNRMQMKLLEKIEELVLYTLEQDEAIRELTTQARQAREELDEVRRQLEAKGRATLR